MLQTSAQMGPGALSSNVRAEGRDLFLPPKTGGTKHHGRWQACHERVKLTSCGFQVDEEKILPPEAKPPKTGQRESLWSMRSGALQGKEVSSARGDSQSPLSLEMDNPSLGRPYRGPNVPKLPREANMSQALEACRRHPMSRTRKESSAGSLFRVIEGSR